MTNAVKIALLFILITASFIIISAQESTVETKEYYTITGRVVDENGKPNTGAGVLIEPVKFIAFSNERFIENVSTDAEGRFTDTLIKEKANFGKEYFIFVTLDTNLDALTVIDAPFDEIRGYDKRFNGKLVKLGNEKLIDVGDVKIQFFYGQANLNFADYFKKKNIDPEERGWRGLYIQIRNVKGNRVYESTLSISDIKKYVDHKNSKIRISLPEGRWKVVILEEPDEPRIAETSYFDIKTDEKPKEIQIVSPPRKK